MEEVDRNVIVSVVMSAYNEELYISQAIESILNQTLKEIELIIINDGSTDKTAEIVLSYNDPRITFVNNSQNLNQAIRANQGVRIAKGKYIARLDADDISLPNRLKKQVEFLELNPDIDILGTQVKIIEEGVDSLYSYKKLPIDPEEVLIYSLFFCPFVHSTVMCKRVVFDEFQYDAEFTLAQDYQLFTRILSKFRGSNMSDVLVHYRRHTDNTHKKNKSRHLSFMRKIFKTHIDSRQIDSEEVDLDVFMLLSDSNPCEIGVEELISIDKWLLKFKSHCLKNNLYSSKSIDAIMAYVWKECYWKVEKNALFSYFRYVIRYKLWKLFSFDDMKYFLKNMNSKKYLNVK